MNTQFKPGDIIVVTGQGRSIEVKVKTAVDNSLYFDHTNWYIQGNRVDNDRPVYIKERPDGVTIALK